jgi:hypothetical protein
MNILLLALSVRILFAKRRSVVGAGQEVAAAFLYISVAKVSIPLSRLRGLVIYNGYLELLVKCDSGHRADNRNTPHVGVLLGVVHNSSSYLFLEM